jgi:hypothetical protein
MKPRYLHLASESQETLGWNLCIRVYNLADIPSGALDHASKEAAGILTSAGVPTVWEQASPDLLDLLITHITGPNAIRQRNP